MAWLGFFPTSYAATGIRTHVRLVAPLCGTLIQDTLPTELPRLGAPTYTHEIKVSGFRKKEIGRLPFHRLN